MEKSQLVAVLRSFSKKEIRDCRKWLQSPAHNQREDVIDLFEYLVGYNHLDNEKFLEKERVFRKIFPDQAYDDARLRQTMFFLLKALEEFLIYQDVFDNQLNTQNTLTSIYRKRNLDKPFQKNLRTAEKAHKKHHYRDSQFLQSKYWIEQEKYEYNSLRKRTAELNLQEMSDSLDRSFLAEKMRLSCIVLSNQAVFKTGYEMGLIDEVLKHIEEKELLDIPAIGIYYYIYKASTERDTPEHFQNLKWHIEENGHLFPKAQARDIYLLALNYCIAKMNVGDKDFFRETFELYRQGIEKKIFIQNGRLDRFIFRNTVSSGILVKEFDWVNKFIQQYKKYLSPQHRENMVHYSLAKLHFEKGEYDLARDYLIHYDYDDILINLNAKSMLIRMYYEEGEFEALESLLESVRNYLHRKKVIGYHKDIYNTLIRFTKRLVRINPYSKEQRKKLCQQIENTRPFPEKKWLLKQLEAL